MVVVAFFLCVSFETAVDTSYNVSKVFTEECRWTSQDPQYRSIVYLENQTQITNKNGDLIDILYVCTYGSGCGYTARKSPRIS